MIVSEKKPNDQLTKFERTIRDNLKYSSHLQNDPIAPINLEDFEKNVRLKENAQKKSENMHMFIVQSQEVLSIKTL